MLQDHLYVKNEDKINNFLMWCNHIPANRLGIQNLGDSDFAHINAPEI